MAQADRAILKNAMPLDWSRTSDAPEVEAAVKTISDQIRALIYSKSPRNLRELWRHTEIVILNLFLAYFHDPERWVFYPRGRGFIAQRTSLSADFLQKVIDGLSNARLIEDRPGERGSGLYDPETQRPLRSRMRATPMLYELLSAHGIRMRMIGSERDFRLVRLKDENKEPMDLPKDRKSQRQIKAMTRNLERINELIESSFIGLHVTDARLRDINTKLTEDKDKTALNFARKKVYRVFNNCSLERGGRFAGGWWQDVPRDERPHIYIGGPKSDYPKFSAEVDYSSMFPSIAYGLLGRELDDRAYQLGETELPKPIRNIVKRVLLTMLMTSDANEARKAAHKALSDEQIKTHRERYAQQSAARKRGKMVMLPFGEFAPDGCPPLKEIIRAMEGRHAALRDRFLYKPDMGLYLMYRESQIAERVMLSMANEGVPVLPIHDSFIAMTSWVGYEREYDPETGRGGYLDTAMRRAFKAELGVECRVTFDKREHEKITDEPDEPKWTDAPDWEELDDPFTEEERKKYGTYVRHYEDWYKK